MLVKTESLLINETIPIWNMLARTGIVAYKNRKYPKNRKY